LVNTVGGFTGGQKFWEADSKSLDQMLNLNVRSGWILARAALRPMLKANRGVIVNIASKAALDHSPTLAAYSASKAAAVAMIDSLAADLKETGVRANSVLPSIIDTEINRKAMPKADFSKWPKPQEIAKVVLFLCTDDAKLINGAAIPVYGDA
jgi:NAD(P)-dependent dehydrogenase (short-subunit alcohol dehydrogenase family)